MATLKIYDDIMSDKEKQVAQLWGMAGGLSFTDVASFCENIPAEDNAIDVLIHCDGGDVLEGWGIYDRLRATGKEITTTVEGSAASMATVIMMAAPKERRRAYANAQFLVHNPWIDPMYIGNAATADELDKAADALREQQDRILDLYVERCGCDREEMAALMAQDKFIGTDEALRLGLIGEVIQPISAKSTNQYKGKNMSLFDKVIEAIKGAFQAEETPAPVMAMDLNTASGDTIRIEREEGAPAVGDKAEPDGEWLMPDNTTIVVENGVITEIRQPEEQVEVVEEGGEQRGDEGAEEERREDDDREQEIGRLKERIAELEAQVAELTELLERANANAKTQDDLRVLNMVAMAGGADKVFAHIQSTFQPAKREPQTAMAEQAAQRNWLKERIEASKSRNKKQ